MTARQTGTFYGIYNAVGFRGDGSRLTNLARANVQADVPNTVVVNDGSGLLAMSSQLSVALGGIGLESGATDWSTVAGNVAYHGGTGSSTLTANVLSLFGNYPGAGGPHVGIFSAMPAAVEPSPNSLVVRNDDGDIEYGNGGILFTADTSSTTVIANSTVNHLSNNRSVEIYGLTNAANSWSSTALNILFTDTDGSSAFPRACNLVVEGTLSLLLDPSVAPSVGGAALHFVNRARYAPGSGWEVSALEPEPYWYRGDTCMATSTEPTAIVGLGAGTTLTLNLTMYPDGPLTPPGPVHWGGLVGLTWVGVSPP